ncbi:EHN domain-containing protein [Fusarium keratoplasticum]|uniref:EHN domain-containing protein n=1 Tax=Fusarium keratoplasticum TaxID=1328300 RepID=A0ACC0QIK7_9HYPO|nr:EHN domain-containing protein [Fusarium keratoplasticum]KAI8657125.1 EHN domain-containing protein [Fusarium keratoplasticum]KAI8658102.1 EHN domain-containing protein [Fusarium keratoplasticum]
MSDIKPYKIHVPDFRIDRLNQKLALTDFPSQNYDPTSTSWKLGPPVNEIERLAKVWQSGFDWRQVEARLNQLPQFTVLIETAGFGTFEVHFVHKESSQAHAIPLLFLHGWPGSFYEVSKIIDPLVQGESNEDQTFHVVAPSLIDFGFSSPSKKGFEFEHHAEVYDKLMQKLGYDRYVIQAGDVGCLVMRYVAKLYGPSRCMACHTNTPVPREPTKDTHPELHADTSATQLTETEKKGLQRTGDFYSEGSGYYKLQSTKPFTIGYSLRDSPVGLLAWIYEKIREWSDEYPWSDEEILTWVSIYYFSTPGPEATSNVYYAMEHSKPPAFAAAAEYVDIPLGISRFSNDLVLLPKLWNQTLGPIVYEVEYVKGGHFAAWERPDAIIQDLRAMLQLFENGDEVTERTQG